MLAVVVVLAACFVQDPPPTSPHDRVIAVAITTNDAPLEGHGGAQQVEYTCAFAGSLHAWTRVANGFDTFLRVDVSGGKRFEDDDSGGKPTPYLRLEVAPGTRLVFTVMATQPGATGEVELHLVAAPETEATLAAAAAAREEIAAIGKLRVARDWQAAKARATALAEQLAATENNTTSDAIEEEVGLAINETYLLELLQPTERLRRLLVAYRSRILPPDHLDLLKARSNLANTQRALGDPRAACRILEQVLEAATRTCGGEHQVVQNISRNLALARRASGDLAGARQLIEHLIAVLEQRSPENDMALLGAQHDLATTLQEDGRLEEARELQERVLAALARTLPADNDAVQYARMNLGNTLSLLGDVARERALREQVLDVFMGNRAPDAADLQMARLNLAATLIALGDLQAGRALVESALASTVGKLPETDPLVLGLKFNLATVLSSIGDHERARTLRQQVLDARLESLPANHGDVQKARIGLAETLLRLDDEAGARTQAEQALAVFIGTLPPDHPELQAARETLALVLSKQGDHASAEVLLKEVLATRTQTLPDDHLHLQAARQRLATALANDCRAPAAAGDEDAARQSKRRRFTELAAASLRGLTHHAQLAILASSSREAEERCAGLSSHLDQALSFGAGFGVFPADPQLDRAAFVLSEVTRGAALASALLVRQAHADARFAPLQEDLRKAGSEIARLAQGGGDREAFQAAVARRDRAERALVAHQRETTGGTTAFVDVSIDALAARLAPNEALVTYRRYVRTVIGASEDSKTDSMCAFVVRAGKGLQRFELGPMAAIEQKVQTWRRLLGADLERGLVPVGGADADPQHAVGEALRRLVFDPLLPALEETSRLVLIADDVLHTIPMDVLPLAPGRLLGDRYTVLHRLSLHEFAPHQHEHTATMLLALGGATFNLEPLAAGAEDTVAVDAAAATPTTGAALLRGGPWERGFDPLTHTAAEARGVAALATELFGESVRTVVLERRTASRESVVALAPTARWLHLATHGWFAPESIPSWSTADPGGTLYLGAGEQRIRGMSPMLLCGLAFAGANLPADAVGRYPGLITAEEIAGWDLTACELAVLSACDTNVGDRRAGQGVASLQKALHMAGARSVITSLWKVPDEATKDLMLDLYRRLWFAKKPKHRALWEAKLRLRNAKDENGRPRYTLHDWAGWVLTGSPD